MTVPAAGIRDNTVITITAKATNGIGKSVSVKLKGVKLTDTVTISGPTKIAAGKSVQLTASSACDEPGWTPTNKKLTWRIESGAKYASISAAGKLTAKADGVGQTLRIYAVAADGSEEYNYLELTVTPPVTALDIQNYPRETVTGKTLNIEKGETARFRVLLAPTGASGEVAWTVNNTAVTLSTAQTDSAQWLSVTVPDNMPLGKIITLTAKATDGSGISAKVNLKVVKPAG